MKSPALHSFIISATLLETHEVYGRYVHHFLGHSPKSIADKHYAAPSQELFDKALDWLRQWIGLTEEWFGIVYDTASTSSMHAVVCARELMDPEARTAGSRNDLVLYTSDQSHMSIEKGAIAVGVGQKNIRKVPSDAEFRMRADALEKMVEEDKRAGKRPFCVVATVGTTSSTSIDPVPQIADVVEKPDRQGFTVGSCSNCCDWGILMITSPGRANPISLRAMPSIL